MAELEGKLPAFFEAFLSWTPDETDDELQTPENDDEEADAEGEAE